MSTNRSLADLLSARVQHAESYLVALEKYEAVAWSALYELYMARQLSVAEALVLVHPRYYEELEVSRGYSVRGDALFGRRVDRYDLPCDAEKVWGMPCQLRNYEALQFDHFFPRSLGGPTLAANRLALCPLHNRVKTNDVHFFAWDRGEPTWMASLVERICRLLAS